jgi:hypothetical protein
MSTWRLAAIGGYLATWAAVSKSSERGTDQRMGTLLWIIAVVLVIAGIVTIVRGGLLWGIVLIVLGLLVGPGGVSIFT